MEGSEECCQLWGVSDCKLEKEMQAAEVISRKLDGFDKVENQMMEVHKVVSGMEARIHSLFGLVMWQMHYPTQHSVIPGAIHHVEAENLVHREYHRSAH